MNDNLVRELRSTGREFYNAAFEKEPVEFKQRHKRNLHFMKLALTHKIDFCNYMQAAKDLWQKANEAQNLYDEFIIFSQEDRRQKCV